MRSHKLDDDAFLVTGEAYDSNSAIFVRGDEALIIDALASGEDAAQLRNFIERELRKRVRFMISTHFFSDHMAALSWFPEAEIIAHELADQTFRSEQFRTAEEAEHYRKPTMLISENLQMDWGKFQLNVFYNPGHTESTLNVDVPAIDALLAADTAVGNIVYLYYSDPDAIRSALDLLLSKRRKNLIQGHGEVASFERIENARKYLENVEREVRKARAMKDPVKAIRAISLDVCMPPRVQASNFERMFHARNIESILNRNLFA